MFNLDSKYLKLEQVKIHFIGIGGIGMSALAIALKQIGYYVSGSDLNDSPTLKKLESIGVKIYLGHRKENIESPSVVVYTSALDFKNNPEIQETERRGIPLIRRAEMLAELMRLKIGVAVAGSHGKTTTTSMIATILSEAQLAPSYIIGGIVANLGGYANIGDGEVLVAEADESDGSFLHLNPIISIITNIDDDHLDFYHSKDNLITAFKDFANRVPFYGCVILNIHDVDSVEIKDKIHRPYFLIGHEKEKINSLMVDYFATNVTYEQTLCSFDLYYKNSYISKVNLQIKGEHNILNSLAAIAATHQLGLKFTEIIPAISHFAGVGRRLETLYKDKNFEIIDDYGHHPTEIISTLKTLRTYYKEYKIVAFFEPHRYSRTKICWEKFLHCFNDADELFMLPIYAASEDELPGINSKKLVEDIDRIHPKFATYVHSFDDVEEMITKKLEKKKLITTVKDELEIMIFLGAGAIGKKIREYLKKIKKI